MPPEAIQSLAQIVEALNMLCGLGGFLCVVVFFGVVVNWWSYTKKSLQ